MSREHVVMQGECIFSIAAATGHAWRTIWEDPANAELRAKRSGPGVLAPGDCVVIPMLKARHESCETDRQHRFVRTGSSTVLKLALLRHGRPRRGEPYVLMVAGVEIHGTTDSEGRLIEPIPPEARTASLSIGAGVERCEFELALGDLDPLDTPRGLLAHLANLGFAPGLLDSTTGPAAKAAICAFQRCCGLPATGEADDATRERIERAHGG